MVEAYVHLGDMRDVRWGMEVGLSRTVRTICLAVRGAILMEQVARGERWES